jgi:hypothetical protein
LRIVKRSDAAGFEVLPNAGLSNELLRGSAATAGSCQLGGFQRILPTVCKAEHQFWISGESAGAVSDGSSINVSLPRFLRYWPSVPARYSPACQRTISDIDHAGERPRKQRENLKAPNGICKLYPLGRLIAELSSVTLVDIVARLGVGAASGV